MNHYTPFPLSTARSHAPGAHKSERCRRVVQNGAVGSQHISRNRHQDEHQHQAHMASTSVEITEAEHPITILAYEFVPDKAGAGKYRGGTPYRRDYRFLEAEAMLQVRSDRRDFRPYGLYGRYPGQPFWNYLNPDGENRLLPSKVTMTILRGTVFRHEVAGAGGWGDPLERDSAAVLKDVRNELVSLTAARKLYDVS